MVWDTIRRDSDEASPMEEWGGIAYALAAADAIPALGSTIVPIIKLGRDLAEPGSRFFRDLSCIETEEGIVVVDATNPRVELHYEGTERRCERLQGGVPAWSWSEVASFIEGCDALYINFITGDEFDLGVAKEVRRNFDGPIYADIHSLTLATGPEGERTRHPLARSGEWLACFDAVQVNEDELAELAGENSDPWEFATGVISGNTRALFVTLGEGGAAYITESRHPLRESSGETDEAGPIAGRLEVAPVAEGDSTGCGDVWGITMFRALLAGNEVEQAMSLANFAASRNVYHRGATGLNHFLKGELARA
jgi:sugar/nucleoside kinase (ribokinase family)